MSPPEAHQQSGFAVVGTGAQSLASSLGDISQAANHILSSITTWQVEMPLEVAFIVMLFAAPRCWWYLMTAWDAQLIMQKGEVGFE